VAVRIGAELLAAACAGSWPIKLRPKDNKSRSSSFFFIDTILSLIGNELPLVTELKAVKRLGISLYLSIS
jgi:hypothetical protein